jgi:exopolysaccharide production protein ExoQ
MVSYNEREQMPTATLERTYARNEEQEPTLVAPRKLGWALIAPLLFFAVHGAFSFQSEISSVGGFSPGQVATRSPGFFGYAYAALTYLIVGWCIKSKLREVLSFAAHFKMLTLLGLLTIISTIWSQNQMYSASRGLFYLIGTLFAYYLVIEFQPEEIMTLVSRLGVVVCLLSLVMVAFFPRFGLTASDARFGVAWQGIFIDRTGAAKCLVFFLSPALIPSARFSKVGRVFYISLLTFMILMAHSVAAIFVLGIYVVFLVLLRFGRKLDPRSSLAVFIVGIIALALLGQVAIEYGPAILQMFGRNPTLSGRTLIWSVLVESILKRPLLGYGYYAFWLGLKGESGRVLYAANWTFGYAHNGILEIFLQLGLVGVVVFFATLVRAVKDAWFCFHNDRRGEYDWYIGLIVLAIFYNIDEATVVWPNDLLSILYVVACCGLAVAVKQLQQHKLVGGPYIS